MGRLFLFVAFAGLSVSCNKSFTTYGYEWRTRGFVELPKDDRGGWKTVREVVQPICSNLGNGWRLPDTHEFSRLKETITDGKVSIEGGYYWSDKDPTNPLWSAQLSQELVDSRSDADKVDMTAERKQLEYEKLASSPCCRVLCVRVAKR